VHIINLFQSSLSRTTLVPRELGALTYDYGIGKHRLLRCLLPDGAEGPGSLNRWMKRQIYEMGPNDPTANNPPKYFVVQEWEEKPEKEVRNYVLPTVMYPCS